MTAPAQQHARAAVHLLRRSFHPSRRRQDIFFVSIPAFKSALLAVIRASLIFLPLAWRWGAFRRFPKFAGRLWQLPLLAICLVVGLGLNQSPKTARWRLLLMSEREELEWSQQRFDDLLNEEEFLLLPPDDPRVAPVRNVCNRLVQALNDDGPLSCVSLTRENFVNNAREQRRRKVEPSARTTLAVMPFLPETSNPEKMMPSSSWNIFCIDRQSINAFVLPSTDIFIYSGLLSVVEGDENLLAAVLAHEIIHVTERHVVEGLGFMALSGVVFDILRGTAWALTLSFPMVGDLLAASFTFIDRRVGQRAYSRKLETEADELGLELMARAGFDPRAAIDLWEILNEVEADVTEFGESGPITDHISLLRTHPTGEQRLADLEKQLPRAMKIYEATLAKQQALSKVHAVLAEVQEQKTASSKASEKVQVA